MHREFWQDPYDPDPDPEEFMQPTFPEDPNFEGRPHFNPQDDPASRTPAPLSGVGERARRARRYADSGIAAWQQSRHLVSEEEAADLKAWVNSTPYEGGR